MSLITIVAAAEAEAGNAGLFDALGLDIKQLLINAGAFLILVAILARWVYPVLIKSVDDRRETIEAALAEAKKSQEAGQEAEKRVESMLAEARKEADGIVARSHTEAQSMVSVAETKAKDRAEQIVKDARAQLDAEVVKARTALRKDTLELVALATEKVVGEKLDSGKDARLIESAITKQAAGAAGERA